MTVTNTTRKVLYVGDGATTAFAFNFPVLAAADLEVYLVVRATGVKTLQTITTEYTVALNAVTEGGTITMITPPPSTDDLLIFRNIALTQPTDIPARGSLSESQLENEYDRSRMIDAQLSEELGRAVLQDIEITGGSLVLPAATAKKSLRWNDAGTALINSTENIDDIGTAATSAAAAAASASAAATSATNAASSAAAAAVSATNADAESVTQNRKNIAVLQFHQRMDQTAAANSAADSWTDVFTDETAVDNATSTNEAYDATNDAYQHTDATTKLLLAFDGADAATTTTDDSFNNATPTFNGNAQLDTAQKKFGTASLLGDGTGDFVSFPYLTDYDLWKPALVTLSFFARLDALASNGMLGADDTSNSWFVTTNSSNKLQAQLGGAEDITLTSSSNWPDITGFHHVAVVWDGSNWGMYIDGTQEAFNASDISGSAVINAALTIGKAGDSGNELDGWIDDVFITHTNHFSATPDVGLTDTITPPAAAHTTLTADMVLQSETLTPDASVQPDSVFVMCLVNPIGSSSPNTHFKLAGSRDDGTNFTDVTLSEDGVFSGSIKIYSGVVSITSQDADETMQWKFTTTGGRAPIVHAIGVQALEN